MQRMKIQAFESTHIFNIERNILLTTLLFHALFAVLALLSRPYDHPRAKIHAAIVLIQDLSNREDFYDLLKNTGWNETMKMHKEVRFVVAP